MPLLKAGKKRNLQIWKTPYLLCYIGISEAKNFHFFRQGGRETILLTWFFLKEKPFFFGLKTGLKATIIWGLKPG